MLGNSIGMCSLSSKSPVLFSGCLPTCRNMLPIQVYFSNQNREGIPGDITEIGLKLLRLPASEHCRDYSAPHPRLRIPPNIAEGTFLFNILCQSFHPQREPATRIASLQQARLFLTSFLFLVQPSLSSSCRRKSSIIQSYLLPLQPSLPPA